MPLHGDATVIVAGAGLAGLCAALALKQAGIAVRVFERSEGPSEVSAGLQLWFNGVIAAERLGVAEGLRGSSTALEGQLFVSARGDPLADIALRPTARRLGLPDPLSVDRRELQAVLTNALGPGEVEYGSSCTGFSQDADGVTVQVGDTREERCSLLVVADGAASRLRDALVPARPIYEGYQYLRAIIGRFDHERLRPGWLYAAFGLGSRFGTVEIGNRRAIFGSFPAEAGTSDPPEGRKADFARRFSDFAAPVGDLVDAIDDDTPIARTDIADIDPLERWTDGRVALAGDAAHATTPNQGRGASEAMEDGLALADCLRDVDLRRGGDVARALGGYEDARRPPTRAVQLNSRRSGKLIAARNPLVARVRDQLVFKRILKRRTLRDVEREFAPSATRGS